MVKRKKVGRSTLYYLGETDEIKIMEKVIEGARKEIEDLVRKGVKLIKENKEEEALEKINTAIELSPENEWAWGLKASAHYRLGQYEDSLKAASKAIELSPENEWAWCLKAAAHYGLGQYEDSLKAASKAIELSPEDEWAWCLKASAHYRLEQYEDSLKAASKAIELSPEDELAWCLKASAHYGLGQYEDSLKAASKAIELSPEDEWAWCWKASAHYRLEQYEDSLKAASKAIELSPENEWAWCWKASAHYRLEQYEDSLKAASKAIELSPEDEWAWYWKAAAHYRLEQYEDELEALKRAIPLMKDEKVREMLEKRKDALEKEKTLKPPLEIPDKLKGPTKEASKEVEKFKLEIPDKLKELDTGAISTLHQEEKISIFRELLSDILVYSLDEIKMGREKTSIFKKKYHEELLIKFINWFGRQLQKRGIWLQPPIFHGLQEHGLDAKMEIEIEKGRTRYRGCIGVQLVRGLSGIDIKRKTMDALTHHKIDIMVSLFCLDLSVPDKGKEITLSEGIGSLSNIPQVIPIDPYQSASIFHQIMIGEIRLEDVMGICYKPLDAVEEKKKHQFEILG
jgi:tetratricopeptide (TPR) repeat protein